jgi:hypothetical protein
MPPEDDDEPPLDDDPLLDELPPEDPPGEPLPVVFPPQATRRRPARAGTARARTRRSLMAPPDQSKAHTPARAEKTRGRGE